MNGGVQLAVESLSATELAESESGYRFFGFGAAADLLSRARKIWAPDQALEPHERQLDSDYASQIPDDFTLYQRFEEFRRAQPSEFARL